MSSQSTTSTPVPQRRRQRSSESATASTPLPLNRIVYLVQIAACYIETWRDAVLFAAINTSSRETVESWLWPE